MNKTIRAGRGLGDAIYLQSVVRHLVQKEQSLTVCTDWQDVFLPLRDKVKFLPFTRQNIRIIAHYSARKSFKDTTQFKDCCVQAGINEPVELKIDWGQINKELIESIKTDKPLLVVALPRAPMGRNDRFAIDLLPKKDIYQLAVDILKEKYTILQIGAGNPIYNLENIDIDLTDKTSVTDLFDIASVADGFLGYCSYIIPLAESFNKKGLYIWANKGLRSAEQYINTITPKKILEHSNSKYFIDNWDEPKIRQIIDDF
jgi:hypothetical protein